MRTQHSRGFSLLELLIVLGIIFVITSSSIIIFQAVQNATAVNSANSMVLREIQVARQLAVDQRCVAHLSFNANGTLPETAGQGTMLIQLTKAGVTTSYEAPQILPIGVQFTTFAGMPVTTSTPSGIPPDSFGTGANAIDFGTDFGGGKTDIYFQPNGTALDAASGGQINNGVVYFGRPGVPSTARAVSLMGATGRVKGWRLVSTAGGLQWK